MYPVLKCGLLAALLVLLGGCWVSEEPLLNSSNASVIDFEGTYRGIGDDDRPQISIRAAGDGSYILHDGEDAISAYFQALKSGWYLAQYEGQDTELGTDERFYIYQPMQVKDGRLHMYAPDCSATPGEYEGLERSGPTCDFTGLDALKSAALAYIGLIEKGEIEQGPNVFEPAEGEQ